MNRYIFPKKEYKRNDVSEMYLHFDNGDYFVIKSSEIINLKINTYDRLVKNEDGVSPVVESGQIKLKICGKHSFIHTSHSVYNPDEFVKNRKSYIENRCVNDGHLKSIWLLNSYRWHSVLLGNFECKLDGEFLLINCLPSPLMGSCDNSEHEVYLKDVKKEDVCKMCLDFENCDGIDVYEGEILDINLQFEESLVWGSSDLFRSVKSGYIKLKFNEDWESRDYTLILNEKKHAKIKDFENRLCGKKGEDVIDICHLYITYNYPGFTVLNEECIETEDIRYKNNYEKQEEDDDEDDYWYESGYAKKLDDGTIIIAFGKNAKNDIYNLINS